MNAAILMALAIFVGIPAGAMLVYWGIERYYDRVMARDNARRMDEWNRANNPFYGKV